MINIKSCEILHNISSEDFTSLDMYLLRKKYTNISEKWKTSYKGKLRRCAEAASYSLEEGKF